MFKLVNHFFRLLILVLVFSAIIPPANAQNPGKEETIFATSPIGVRGGIIASKNNDRLMVFNRSFQVAYSEDGGRSWGKFKALNIPDKANKLSGVIRLANGNLGIWSDGFNSPLFWWASNDEGKTWSERVKIGSLGGPLHGNVMIQSQKGRLLLPVRTSFSIHSGIKTNAGSFVLIDGERKKVEGHGHFMEMDISFLYYSDNQGRRWRKSEGYLVIWKEDGYGGMWPCDEPNIVELRDGRLLMFIRTTLGRIYRSTSKDGGRRWSYPEPTELASSYSPCSLKRIPGKDDLLCVWNNVSANEIRRGFRRGRLSSAVSKDDGRTWNCFKTIDTAGLVSMGKAPLSPPEMVRADKVLGELPEGFGNVSYPDIFFYEDMVLVKYIKRLLKPDYKLKMLKILPLKWFYCAPNQP